MYWNDYLRVTGYTFLISGVLCSKLTLRTLVSLVEPPACAFLHSTITCISSPSMYEMTDSNSTMEPISTGPRNWISSICVHLGNFPPRNRQALSHPSSQAMRMMYPPKILPDRFLSCRCISWVFLSTVSPMLRKLFLSLRFYYRDTSRLCTSLDSSQVGGETLSPRAASRFLVCCLFSPSSLLILKCSGSFSILMGGTLQALPVFLSRAAMTNLAEQAILSLPSISCVTVICTSMELLPTYVTQPQNEQFSSAMMGWKKSISSTAAVTVIKGSSSIYLELVPAPVQYRQATLAAMQSISSSTLPTRTYLSKNCIILRRRV